MGLNSRLKRLEQAQEPRGEYQLYSPAGDDLTGAEMLSRPTLEAEGVACLTDGTEKAVIWKGKVVFVFGEYPQNELWWVQEERVRIFHFGDRLTEDDI